MTRTTTERQHGPSDTPEAPPPGSRSAPGRCELLVRWGAGGVPGAARSSVFRGITQCGPRGHATCSMDAERHCGLDRLVGVRRAGGAGDLPDISGRGARRPDPQHAVERRVSAPRHPRATSGSAPSPRSRDTAAAFDRQGDPDPGRDQHGLLVRRGPGGDQDRPVHRPRGAGSGRRRVHRVCRHVTPCGQAAVGQRQPSEPVPVGLLAGTGSLLRAGRSIAESAPRPSVPLVDPIVGYIRSHGSYRPAARLIVATTLGYAAVAATDGALITVAAVARSVG